MKHKIKYFKKEFTQERMICGEHIRQCLVSWNGHAKHGNTYNLRRKLFKKLNSLSELRELKQENSQKITGN
ncbi:hypothetical protein SBF1_3120004 [Candidatus Desulfosporosinus infrequens]|uniref:Uncharacterized protein n=1 Tax=Candidatus Desulfosporosinus infrequens TaxID=2043169 RepID=A0A2U3KZ96_9FIRM|nr:hypothetical protein SBF1_3120004 [Candidatus Desulfosporosinus infrequens]